MTTRTGAQELQQFLHARITEDELTASLAAQTTQTVWETRESADGGPDAVVETSGARVCRPSEQAQAEHIALWDPARVLRESVLKRSVLARHGFKTASWGQDRSDEDRAQQACTHCMDEDWPCPDVRAVVEVYRGHPGWREQWLWSH